MDLSIDTRVPIRSPSPAAIASALVHCTTSMTLTAEPAWGRCHVTRLSPTAVVLDHYGPTGIRRAAPVTVALATTALQALARGDPTWDGGITWEISERLTRQEAGSALAARMVVILMILMLMVPPTLCIVGTILLRDQIVAHQFNPRCQAYAVAHEDHFVRYSYDKRTGYGCRMASGVVPISVTPRVALPGLWNVLYHHGWWIFMLSFIASVAVGSATMRWWMWRSRR